jgi:hypothetical protein
MSWVVDGFIFGKRRSKGHGLLQAEATRVVVVEPRENKRKRASGARILAGRSLG